MSAIETKPAVAGAPPRQNYAGTPADFAEGLNEVVKALGKVWLVYDECPKVEDAKVLPAEIKKAYRLLSSLQHMQHNISFNKVLVREGITLLAKSFDYWDMKQELREHYVETMTRRVRNLCRAVWQNRKSNAEWAQALPWCGENVKPKQTHKQTQTNDRLIGRSIGQASKHQWTPWDHGLHGSHVIIDPMGPCGPHGSHGLIPWIPCDHVRLHGPHGIHGFHGSMRPMSSMTFRRMKKLWIPTNLQFHGSHGTDGFQKNIRNDKKIGKNKPRREERISHVAVNIGVAPDGLEDIVNAPTFFYGYAPELRKAWRVPVDSRGKEKEACESMNYADEALDSDPMLATWSDGHEHLITDITVGQWKAQIQPRNQHKEDGTLWEGTHSTTHHRLRIAPRADRDEHGLVSLYEQQRQVLQVMVKWFMKSGEDGLYGATEAVAEAAIFLQKIARRYANNDFDTDQLIPIRDAALTDAGIDRKPIKKRPAGAEHLPDSTTCFMYIYIYVLYFHLCLYYIHI